MSNNPLTVQANKVVLGIDIGTSKVVAVIGALNENGKLNIIGQGRANCEGVVSGQVLNIDKTANAINLAVAEAAKTVSVEIDEINISISGPNILSALHRNGITRIEEEDEISAEDIKRLVDETFSAVVTPVGYKILHALPQKYHIDGQAYIYDPVGRQGARLEADFNVVSATMNSILNISKSLKRNDITANNHYEAGLASALAVLLPEEMDMGVVLIDMGAGTTEILIFHDKVLRHLSVLPFGGNIITKDIVEGCNIQEKQAEAIKQQVGNAIPENTIEGNYIAIPGIKNRASKEISVRNLSRIIAARTEELFEIIDNEISNSGWADRMGAGIVLTGGCANMLGLKQLVETMTGFEVRIGHPNEYLGKSKTEAIKNPSYATAVGLALAGSMYLDERDKAHNTAKRASKAAKPKAVSNNGSNPSKSLDGIFKKLSDFINNDDDSLPDKY